MMTKIRTTSTIGALALTAIAGTANAGVVASYGFTDLNAGFSLNDDNSSGMFLATSMPRTSGDVTRLLGPEATADLGQGAYNGSTSASIELAVSVDNIDAISGTADGMGTVVITDVDGDTLTGSFSGSWLGGPLGFSFFSSSGSDFAFGGNGNGTFDGLTGGFDPTTLGAEVFIGALSILFQQPNSSFFQEDFAGVSTQFDGILVVPAPASAALALGGLLAASRRRRS